MHKLNLALVTLIFSIAVFLSACEQPTAVNTVSSRPVKTLLISSDISADKRTFPAVVDAIRKADISFRVSGKIQNIHVREGDSVTKEQLLAELDPTDFEIRLKDRQASYDTAKANYDRAKSLVEKGAISRVDHDNIRAKYHTARAALDEAEQDLKYTRLQASFDGFIAKRHVENFEEVQASQTIFSLQDVSALKLIIDLPENLMISLKKVPQSERDLRARFASIKDVDFPLTFVEATTKADAATKTFKVTLKMDAPVEYNILPGMTATVYANAINAESADDLPIMLPSSAVVAGSDKQASVWVVDEKTMTVSPKSVSPGLLIGDSIQVTGLEAGDRIVTAGASFLRDGMKVTLLETGEQPQ